MKTLSSRLPLAVRERYRVLRPKHLDFVLEELVRKKELATNDWPKLKREFFRFLALVSHSENPLAMIGPKIDLVWHQFILFSKEYRIFCLANLGFIVDHLPNTKLTPVPSEAISNFVSQYLNSFGKLNPIWFEGMTEEQAAKVKYLEKCCIMKTSEAETALAAHAVARVLKWSGWPGPSNEIP